MTARSPPVCSVLATRKGALMPARSGRVYVSVSWLTDLVRLTVYVFVQCGLKVLLFVSTLIYVMLFPVV